MAGLVKLAGVWLAATQDDDISMLSTHLGALVQVLRGIQEALALEKRSQPDGFALNLIDELLGAHTHILTEVDEYHGSVNGDAADAAEMGVKMKKKLLKLVNTLTIGVHLAQCTNSEVKAAMVQLIQTQLEDSCKWIYKQEIYPPILPMTDSEKMRLSFRLYEAELVTTSGRAARATYTLVCPGAALPTVDDDGRLPSELQFRCLCHVDNHTSALRYNVLAKQPELAIPVEEAGPYSAVIYRMILSKADATVSVRLSNLLPIHFGQLERLFNRLAAALIRRMRKGSDQEIESRTGEALWIRPDRVSVLRTRSTAPLQGLKILSCELKVEQIGRRPQVLPLVSVKPPYIYWQILHYATSPKYSVISSGDEISDSFFSNEPFFILVISKQLPSKILPHELYKIKISNENVIREEDGENIVTISDVDCISEIYQKDRSLAPRVIHGHCASVQIKFMNSNDGTYTGTASGTFIRNIEYMKNILGYKACQMPLQGEEIVYQHSSINVFSESAPAIGAPRVTVVHNPKAQVGSYRYIVAYGPDGGTICFELDSISPQAAPDGWAKLFTSKFALVVYRTSSGALLMERKSWEELEERPIKRRAKTSSLDTTTFSIKRENENSSTRWFDELADTVDILQAKKGLVDKDEMKLYKRVKIAVIDTGFTSNTQDPRDPRNTARKAIIKYRDFVTRPKPTVPEGTKHKGPVEEPMDDPLTSMRDDASDTHGTVIVELVLKVYRDAELYVARTLRHNTGSKEELKGQPVLMADAINWAAAHKVDIINISAGFKTCPLALHRAVRDAHAAGILIFASPGNWARLYPVAFPARLSGVTCVFATTAGLINTDQINPEPLRHTHNFALLGRDILHRGVPFDGTSPATAIASGFAARILDFIRQPEVRDLDNVELLATKAGMAAVFQKLANLHQGYDCVHPGRIGALNWDESKDDDEAERKKKRRRAVMKLLVAVLYDMCSIER